MDSHPNWFHRVLLCFEIVVVCEMNGFWVMVFNVTFSNISLISWWSVLLVEETEVPGEIRRPAASGRDSNSQLNW